MPEKRVEVVVDGRRIVAVNTWFAGEWLEVDGIILQKTRNLIHTRRDEPLLTGVATGDSGQPLYIEVFLSVVADVRIMILVNGVYAAGDRLHDDEAAARARAEERLRQRGASASGLPIAVPSIERPEDLDTQLQLSTDEIAASLSDARVWCAQRANVDAPSTCLRSREIASASEDWAAKVRDVFRLRRTAIATGPKPGGAEVRAPGDLLVYVPDVNLADGAAEVQSQGFFDLDNAPPWDTWVAYVRCTPRVGAGAEPRALLAWIPRVFVETAQLGIDVNPEECIGWARRDPDARLRAMANRISVVTH